MLNSRQERKKKLSKLRLMHNGKPPINTQLLSKLLTTRSIYCTKKWKDTISKTRMELSKMLLILSKRRLIINKNKLILFKENGMISTRRSRRLKRIEIESKTKLQQEQRPLRMPRCLNKQL